MKHMHDLLTCLIPSTSILTFLIFVLKTKAR